MRTELQVAALKNGTAIDHIPPEQLFKVVALLQLDHLKNPITIGNNLESKKMGSKGIIKKKRYPPNGTTSWQRCPTNRFR